MTTRHGILAPVVARVSRWPGVEPRSAPGRTTFLVDGQELGGLDDDGTVTAMTTTQLRDQLLTDGMADPAPGHVDRVRYRIRSPADIPGAIRLLRVAYVCRGEAATTLRPELGRLGVSDELLSLVVHARRGP